VPLVEFTLQDTNNQAYGLEQLRGKWSVVYFASGCDAGCAETLYDMRQSRLAQGKEYHRVQLVHVPLDGAVSEQLQALLPEHPKLTVLTGRPHDVQNMWRQFAAADPVAEPNRSGVYIVDPLGNLMMSYPGDFTPKQLIKDLQRLLYVSQIG
ncbi:MAG: SCO family protein, partial [Pseudomonadota bacterium]